MVAQKAFQIHRTGVIRRHWYKASKKTTFFRGHMLTLIYSWEYQTSCWVYAYYELPLRPYPVWHRVLLCLMVVLVGWPQKDCLVCITTLSLLYSKWGSHGISFILIINIGVEASVRLDTAQVDLCLSSWKDLPQNWPQIQGLMHQFGVCLKINKNWKVKITREQGELWM